MIEIVLTNSNSSVHGISYSYGMKVGGSLIHSCGTSKLHKQDSSIELRRICYKHGTTDYKLH